MSFAQRHSASIERQCGINGGQLWVLAELQKSPGMRVSELVARLAAHQSTVSNLVDELVKKGLVSKAPSPKDRRVMLLALTADGEAMLSKAPLPARGVLPEALSQMEAKHLKALDDSLQHLIETMHGIDDSLGLNLLPFNLAAR